MGRLLTQSQYARKKKVDRSTVHRWVRDGKIKLSVDHRIDPVAAEKDLMSNNMVSNQVDSTKSKRRSRKRRSSSKATTEPDLLNQTELTLTDVRRQNEILKGELLGLKVKVERGDLVPRDQATQWLFGHVDEAKNAFWSLPRRMGPVLAPVSDEKEIEFVLRKEIREILTRLAEPGGKEALQIIESGGSVDQQPIQ